jgi:hypothetical protein
LHEKINGRSLLIDAMLKAEVDAKSTVSLAEARAYYDKNPARFEYPEGFAIQTISFLPPEKPTPDSLKEERKRAEDASEAGQSDTSYEQFGMLAEKISEDDYRVMMGDHKRVDRANWRRRWWTRFSPLKKARSPASSRWSRPYDHPAEPAYPGGESEVCRCEG